MSRTSRRGLTLVETLIALAICAALLACMAVAFSAAGSAMEMNDHYYRSLQQARSGMDLMMNEIRRCDMAAGNIYVTSNSIELQCAPDFKAASGSAGDDIVFTYNSSGAYANTITLTDKSVTPNPTSVLVGELQTDGNSLPVDVSSCTINGPATLGASNTNGSVSVTMTVQLGVYPTMNQIVLSGSAAPRGALTAIFQ